MADCEGLSSLECAKTSKNRDTMIFFFKQKTAYEILTCDWSSDVCSSDLITCT